MKLLIAITVLAALSACSQKTEETAAPPETIATRAPADVPGGLAVDGKPNVGNYEITFPGGRIAKQTYRADGTFSTTIDGKTVTGVWAMTKPGVYCTTLEGEAKPTCSTDKMDGNVWLSTSNADPTVTYTVKRIE